MELNYLSPDLPLIVRLANQGDYSHILGTWVNHAHKTEPACFIPKAIFWDSQTKLINSILDSATSHVICLDDEPELIIGYLVHQPYSDNRHIIHWGNVKSHHRRQGYMKMLLSHLQLDSKQLICTQYFKKFKNIKDKYKLIYDPTLLENYV